MVTSIAFYSSKIKLVEDMWWKRDLIDFRKNQNFHDEFIDDHRLISNEIKRRSKKKHERNVQFKI